MISSKIDFEKNYELLHETYFNRNGLIYNAKYRQIIPFISNQITNFEYGFKPILGNITRMVLNKKDLRLENEDEFCDRVISNIFENTEVNNENIFKKLLREYLLDDTDSLKIATPKFYLGVSSKSFASDELNISHFIRDIFLLENNNEYSFKNFLSSFKSNNVLIDLIEKNIDVEDTSPIKPKYYPVLNEIIELFNKDFKFALEHEDWFLDNMELFFAYYYFYYVSSLILEISKEFNSLIGDYSDFTDELFYLVDWEKINKNRSTIKYQGYDFLKDKAKYTYAQFSMIDQLNILIKGEKNNDSFDDNALLIRDIYKFYDNDLEENSQKKFIYYLKKWIKDCRQHHQLEDIDLSDDLQNLLKILYESLNDKFYSTNEGSYRRFNDSLTNLVEKFFAKSRGHYGYVFNMNKKLILMITALSINKNELNSDKIKIEHLFKEYELRGIYLDNASKEEVKQFLEKLNLIDKKSDSGDAQYVRSIL